MALCGMVSGTGKKTREGKTHLRLSELPGEYLIPVILAEAVSDSTPNQRLLASGLVPLPYCKPILRAWLDWRQSTQHLAELSSLYIKNIILLFSICWKQQCEIQDIDQQGLHGGRTGLPTKARCKGRLHWGCWCGIWAAPRDRPGCCVAVEQDGSTGPLLRARGGLAFW